MVRVEDATVVKLKREGHDFEVLADPDAVLAIREGKDVSLDDALAIVEVFRDAHKGDHAGHDAMESAFGTDDPYSVADTIVREGEFHLTTEQKRKLAERKRNQLINEITVNSVDPRTNLPHTRERVERAMENARVRIDDRPVAQQLDEVVKALQPVLPLRFGTATLDIIVPAEFAPSLYGRLKGMGKLKSDKWLANGSLEAKLEVPSGAKADVISRLGNATKGEVIVKEV
jgi:ribosome maturation protein SDO1